MIKKSYTSIIDGTTIFKADEFSEMFLYKEYWEDSYTKFSNKIGLTSSGKFIDESTDVVLDFPYKDTVLKAGMSKEDVEKDDLKPDEPFLNETFSRPEIDELFEPKILVNAKKYDKDGDHKVTEFSEKDNLIIKGNNLIALHSLEKRYAGKVKLIYIDVPYNTGKDSFKYNDSFNESSWLTFIKNRIEISKNLLKEDGIIFVSIDRNEFSELKILMQEVFGKRNYLGTIINVSTPNGRDYGSFAQIHEYIHVFSKNSALVKTNKLDTQDKKKFKMKDKLGKYYLHPLFNSNSAYNKNNRPNLFYPIYVKKDLLEEGLNKISLEKTEGDVEVFPPKSQKDGTQFVWRWGKEKVKKQGAVDLAAQLKKDGNYRIVQKMRPQKQIPRTVWIGSEFSTRRGTEEIQKLFNKKAFGFPKPEELIMKILEIGSDKGDIVLDFFMGSGTTQAVAMKMGRRFIGIEQMNYINTISVPRLQKVIDGEQGGISKDVDWQGGGSFVYAELMEKNQGYLNDVLNAQNSNELNKVYDRMKDNVDFDFRVDLDSFEKDKDKLSFEDQRDMLVKIIDKNQLYYNEANIDDKNVHDILSDVDYQFNKSFYGKGDDLNA